MVCSCGCFIFFGGWQSRFVHPIYLCSNFRHKTLASRLVLKGWKFDGSGEHQNLGRSCLTLPKTLASPSLFWDTYPQKSEANWTNRTHEEYSRLHRFWFKKKNNYSNSRKYPTQIVRPQNFESLWKWKFQPTTHSQRKVIKLEDSHTDSSKSPLSSLTWNKSDWRSKNVISVCSRFLRKCSNTICICDVESDFKTSLLNTPQSPCVFQPAQVGDHPKLRSNSMCHLCRCIGFASWRVLRVVCPNQIHGSTSFGDSKYLQIKGAKLQNLHHNLMPCQNVLQNWPITVENSKGNCVWNETNVNVNSYSTLVYLRSLRVSRTDHPWLTMFALIGMVRSMHTSLMLWQWWHVGVLLESTNQEHVFLPFPAESNGNDLFEEALLHSQALMSYLCFMPQYFVSNHRTWKDSSFSKVWCGILGCAH